MSNQNFHLIPIVEVQSQSRFLEIRIRIFVSERVGCKSDLTAILDDTLRCNVQVKLRVQSLMGTKLLASDRKSALENGEICKI
jgi:hypothetical protein